MNGVNCWFNGYPSQLPSFYSSKAATLAVPTMNWRHFAIKRTPTLVCSIHFRNTHSEWWRIKDQEESICHTSIFWGFFRGHSYNVHQCSLLNHGLGFINAALGLGKSLSNNRMGTTRIGIREGDFWGRGQGVVLIYWVNRHPWYSRLNPCYAREARFFASCHNEL